MSAYRPGLVYWWGGDEEFSGAAEFHLAFSGQGGGTVLLADIGPGTPGLPSSFTAKPTTRVLPARSMFRPPAPTRSGQRVPGIGFRQRRAER